MNARQQFEAAFGDSAKKLDYSSCAESWLEMECGPARLVCDEQGRQFCICGSSHVIIAVSTLSDATCLTFYLVVDDSAGKSFDAWIKRFNAGEEAEDWTKYHSGRPCPTLRVCASN